jgi:hypothetical protein
VSTWGHCTFGGAMPGVIGPATITPDGVLHVPRSSDLHAQFGWNPACERPITSSGHTVVTDI